MYPGTRVIDGVSFLEQRGRTRHAVRLVRQRPPERFRWRTAVSWVAATAARLSGRDRWSVEEPVREMVLDLPDRDLRREVILDARRYGIDLDRGEVLPERSLMDLTRLTFLTETRIPELRQLVELPHDLWAPIETSATVLGCRRLAWHYRQKAQREMLRLPDPDLVAWDLAERSIARRAAEDHRLAKRWAALATALLDDRA